MALITWTAEKYGTKVDICDDQHKTLFGLLNDLDDAAAGGDRGSIGSKLDALINFVVEHFATEEKLMQQKNYGGYAAHKAEHDKLVATCADLAVECAFKRESGVIGHDEDKGNVLRAIEFPRINGGKPFDIDSPWFNDLLKAIGQSKGKKVSVGH